MDRNMIVRYSSLTVCRIIKDKKFIGILIYLFLLPLIIMIMNEWSTGSNGWNAVFFIFGNRYIYFLFLVSAFLILLDEIANGGNIRYCASRLMKKKNVVLSQMIVMLIVSGFFTIYLFSVVIGQSLFLWGADINWSPKTIQGLDSYTYFASTLTPIQSLLLFVVRYFVCLLFIGSLFLLWQSLTNRRYTGFGMILILMFLFANASLNFINIPIIKFIDVSQAYVYAHHGNQIVQYIIKNHTSLILLSIGCQICALLLCKRMRY